MSIHQTIYDTINLPPEEVMDIIGSGDIAGVVSRQVKMRVFLVDNKWNIEKYKDFLKGQIVRSKGVGDTIAKITKTIGITACGGCKQRQEKLNKIFPYKVK
jgi:hypothetical protein